MGRLSLPDLPRRREGRAAGEIRQAAHPLFPGDRRRRPALTKKLEKLIAPPGFAGNKPGGPSRWSTERSGEWCPLEPKLVLEVCYDHFSGGRFRHGTVHDAAGEAEEGGFDAVAGVV